MQNSTISPAAARVGERTELTGRWKTDNLICITRSHGASPDNLILADGLKRAEKLAKCWSFPVNYVLERPIGHRLSSSPFCSLVY